MIFELYAPPFLFVFLLNDDDFLYNFLYNLFLYDSILYNFVSRFYASKNVCKSLDLSNFSQNLTEVWQIWRFRDQFTDLTKKMKGYSSL